MFPHMLSYFILKITLLGRYCYESHLSEEAVELRGLKRIVSKKKKKTCLKTLASGILARLCVYVSAEGLV